MRIFLAVMVVGFIIGACSQSSEPVSVESEEISEVAIDKITKVEADEKINRIELKENNINGVDLPLNREMSLDQLVAAFKGYQVTKEIGMQDGPDFPLYSVKSNDQEILFFKLNDEDTLKLDQIIVKTDTVQDEYGIRVGMTYADVRSRRGEEFELFVGDHWHTYMTYENSNVYYDVIANIDETDSEVMGTTLTKDQVLAEGKVKYLYWSDFKK